MIHFDIANLKLELKELEKRTNEPNFWQDSEKGTPILRDAANEVLDKALVVAKDVVARLEKEKKEKASLDAFFLEYYGKF